MYKDSNGAAIPYQSLWFEKTDIQRHHESISKLFLPRKISESFNWGELAEKLTGSVDVYCGYVDFINSYAIKYMLNNNILADKELFLYDVTHPVLQLFDVAYDIFPRATIISVDVPVECENMHEGTVKYEPKRELPDDFLTNFENRKCDFAGCGKNIEIVWMESDDKTTLEFIWNRRLLG